MGNSPSRSDARLSAPGKPCHGHSRSRASSISRSRHGSRTPTNNSGRLSIIATSGVPGVRRSRSATPFEHKPYHDELPPPYTHRPAYSRSGSHASSRNPSMDKLDGKRKSTKGSSTPSSSASPTGEKSMPWDNADSRESYSKQIKLATSSILKQFHTVVIVDDSSSMQGARWEEADRALADLADYAGKYDADGIDIHFLNDSRVGENIRNAQQVRNLFSQIVPRGVTPIGATLERLLSDYFDQLDNAEKTGGREAVKKVKPVNFIVITDGEPTDDPESVIVQAAMRLDAKYRPITQVGIQFVQIGPLQSAARYLAHLDDALSTKHRIRDIVDTTRYSGKRLNAETLIKILVGGINKRVDAEGGKIFRADFAEM